MDFGSLVFAFSAGTAAFFSPCAVAMLPAYVTYVLSKKPESKKHQILSSMNFALKAILGFFTIFGLAGISLIIAGHSVKKLIPGLALATGVILIIVGVAMLFGKKIMIKLPQVRYGTNAYLFGIAYAIGALGCTFPLFVSAILIGVNESSLFNGFLSLLAYLAGLSILMIILTLASAFARSFIQKYINKIIPYIYKVSAVILIAAGFYFVWYQFA